MSKTLVPLERIENRIYLIRGQKVMLDFDLALLYGVQTKNLKRQVKRNIKRFPSDFMLQLTKEEYQSLKRQFGDLEKEGQSLRCQFGTSSQGGRRHLPYAFTEQGIAMLSSILKSERAILMNIAIMRAFVKLRQMLLTHKKLANEFKKLKKRVGRHDEEITAIFDVIRKLMAPLEKPARKIGFIQGE